MTVTTNLRGRPKNGNTTRCLELWAGGKGKTFAEIGVLLGISPRTARGYVREYGPVAVGTTRDSAPRCRCSLRLSTPGELASGRCSNCLPDSATAFLGRRGEPAACATGLRHGGQ